MTNEELLLRIARKVKRKDNGDVLTIWGIRMWGSTLRADTRDEEGLEWSVIAEDVDPHYEPLTEEVAKTLRYQQKLEVIPQNGIRPYTQYVYVDGLYEDESGLEVMCSHKRGTSEVEERIPISKLELVPFS